MITKPKGAFRKAALAGLCALTGTVMGLTAETASAAPLVYQLNTVINGNTLTPAAASYGTVTYEDFDTSIKVTIDLANHTNGASKFLMNYDDSKFPIDGGYSWNVFGDANSITAHEDALLAGTSTAGKFDIRLSHSPTFPWFDSTFFGPEPYVFFISLTSHNRAYNLSVDDFNFTTDAGGLYNAVLIDCDPIWVGSRVVPAPEPASMALLGAGLIGTVMTARRRRSAAPAAVA